MNDKTDRDAIFAFWKNATRGRGSCVHAWCVCDVEAFAALAAQVHVTEHKTLKTTALVLA
jgi:hypothetical protein